MPNIKDIKTDRMRYTKNTIPLTEFRLMEKRKLGQRFGHI